MGRWKKTNQSLHIKWEPGTTGLKSDTTVKITGNTGKEGKSVCYDVKMNCKRTCQISTELTILHSSKTQIGCFWDQEFEWWTQNCGIKIWQVFDVP